MLSPNIHYALIAAVMGAIIGKRIGWAIRAWPGHEEFHCDYLDCPDCEGGKRRGCFNAGRTQDRVYILFSALVAGLSVYGYGPTLKAFISWMFSVSCMIITIVDIRYLIIPDTLSINGCWTGLVFAAICSGLKKMGYGPLSYSVGIQDSLIGFIAGGGFLWLLGWVALILLKKEGMGGGDVKLLGAFGAWAGWQAVVGTVVIASFLGAFFGVMGIIYRKIRYGTKYKPLSHMIPFGPYLCIGFLFTFFFGIEPLLDLMHSYNAWVLGLN
ncbi:MAG: A24 family peptidase [Candidatus Rifleibacteriota bacterium]